MIKENDIDMSVIIPVYNAEDYLPACIDSLMNQGDLQLEVIIVNDGSTDSSCAVAEEYAQKDSRIKIIHQKNGGASAARNAGLELAKGEYVAFIDSDDWVKENGLYELYREAVFHQADMVMGKIQFFNQDGKINSIYRPVPKDCLNIPFSGKECFIRLVRSLSYTPMAPNYIYRRKHLDKIQVRFEEGIMAEDELWTPVVLCQAEKAVIVDIEFYLYRQQDDSVMHTTNRQRYLKSLFRVTEKLFEFIDRYDFSDNNRELKSWFYVNIYKLYSIAFESLSRLKDSSFILPEHHLYRFQKDGPKMTHSTQILCKNYLKGAEIRLKKYTDWRSSSWVASVPSQIIAGEKLMLIYNTLQGEDLSLRVEDVPADWIITTDRRYFKQADVVVFHLPDLRHDMDTDLNKPDGQIWVAWYMESETNYPWIRSQQIRDTDTFELWMSHKKDTDVLYPYYQYEYLDYFTHKVNTENKQNSACISFSNRINEKKNTKYLRELMEYTEIDSYGRMCKKRQQSLDRNTEKLDFYRNYKFVIAFEDAIEPDYVTEKFFNPLVAGSVPVYFGAPNIEDFAPGDNCFVDVRQFENPRSLAQFINACYEDEQLYFKFFEWKNKPLRQSFLQKIEEQKEHPFVRLCRKVDEILSEKFQNI